MLKTILCSLCILFCNVYSSQKKIISVRDFGVDGQKYTHESDKDKYYRWEKIKSAFETAVAENKNLYFPKGIYDVGSRNFPFRTSDNATGVELLDCRGLIIYGEEGTVFMTTSDYGADVLQLNKVKNLTIKNLEITAVLHKYTRSGSNGISITNGFDNIKLENIKVYNLPGVDKGTYIDGGKGLTLQFAKGAKSYKGTLVTKQIEVDNCAYGFRMDAVDLSDMMRDANTIEILLDMSISKAYQGFSVEYGAATENSESKSGLNINADIILDNCQQYVRLSRVIGGKFNIVVKKSDRKLRKIWNMSDKLTFAFLGNYVKNAKVQVRGDVGKVDQKILLGAVGSIIEPSNIRNATENSEFNIDVSGRSLKNDFTLIEFNGDSINDSQITITNRTLDRNTNIENIVSAGNNTIQVRNLH